MPKLFLQILPLIHFVVWYKDRKFSYIVLCVFG